MNDKFNYKSGHSVRKNLLQESKMAGKGGSSGGGGGSKGGGGTGKGTGGGYPSTTGNPSGGGRSNTPK